jgi:molybdopterin converting factor small subunit
MLMDLSSESSNNYVCDLCDYSTSRNSQFQRHIKTDKHQNNEKSTICQQISTNFNNLGSKFVCDCGKIYKERTGLWRHKKNCCNNKDMETIKEKAKTITDKDELIMFLIKECTDYKNIVMEQQNMMMKVIENGVGNNTNINSNSNSNNNNHNKTFNLQVFLNETCKDAMNITDFVNSIKLQVSDLEKLGEVGYVEGISNIITTNLKALDVTLRPVHCTDKKRETMYIKDENQWTKEDDTKTKLRKAINRIADKNIRLLPQFREKYPDYNNSSSKISDKYEKMVIEVMTTDHAKEDKIIRNISNATTIEKLMKEK